MTEAEARRGFGGLEAWSAGLRVVRDELPSKALIHHGLGLLHQHLQPAGDAISQEKATWGVRGMDRYRPTVAAIVQDFKPAALIGPDLDLPQGLHDCRLYELPTCLANRRTDGEASRANDEELAMTITSLLDACAVLLAGFAVLMFRIGHRDRAILALLFTIVFVVIRVVA